MQNADGHGATAPRSKADPLVEILPPDTLVLADRAGLAIGLGRLFSASVGLRARGGAFRSAPVRRSVDIPVVGPDGEVSGILLHLPPAAEFCALSAPINSARRCSGDEITKIIVHDMNNLLAVIDGNLSLLERQSDAEARAAIFARLRGAVDKGAVLTRRLLDEGTLARHGCSGTSPSQLLGSVEALRPSLSPDSLLEIEVDPALWPFKADSDELYFALLNLCRNADAAMCKAGLIVVSAANLVAQSDDGHSGMVAITVRDNGLGMTEEIANRVFEPYFTTKEFGVGTGLGLAQVRAFVERQGGSIQLQSEPGIGTTVQLVFPRMPDDETDAPVHEPNLDGGRSRSDLSTVGYSLLPNGGIFYVVPARRQPALIAD